MPVPGKLRRQPNDHDRGTATERIEGTNDVCYSHLNGSVVSGQLSVVGELLQRTSDSGQLTTNTMTQTIPQPVRPGVAIITNSQTPYRLALHLRIARELPQLRLWSLFTHDTSN